MQLILVLILSSIFVFVIAGWEDQVKQLYANAIDSSALLLPNCPLPMSQTKPSSGCEHFHAVSWFNRYDSANNIMIAVVLK